MYVYKLIQNTVHWKKKEKKMAESKKKHTYNHMYTITLQKRGNLVINFLKIFFERQKSAYLSNDN